MYKNDHLLMDSRSIVEYGLTTIGKKINGSFINNCTCAFLILFIIIINCTYAFLSKGVSREPDLDY